MIEDAAKVEYLVLGLGSTGFSCVEFLAKCADGIIVADTRSNPPFLQKLQEVYPSVPVLSGPFEKELLLRAKTIVISPGVALPGEQRRLASDNGVEIIGDIELFARCCNAPVIGVTGSNGKSTVVTLLTEMFRRSGKSVGLGGNVGIPALQLLQQDTPDFYVLELSSFQLENVRSLDCFAAAVLNVTADHMDRYASVDDYIAAKRNIYSGSGLMVINLDDSACRAMQQDGREIITWTLRHDTAADFYVRSDGDSDSIYYRQERLLAVADIGLEGAHNLANVMVCLALGTAAGIDLAPMVAVAGEFTGLPHRCQRVYEADGVTWVNDSKATNTGAAIAAISGLSAGNSNIVLIAGGDGKGADFTQLGSVIDRLVKYTVLLGRDGGRIADVISDRSACCFATDMTAAVNVAASIAVAGDIVLLSPACASLDMYSDYQERGNAFITAVHALVGKAGTS